MKFRIPFSGRGHGYTDEEIETVASVMQNAETLTQGRYRDCFEKKIREYIGVSHAFACCNATAALEMAAQLCLFEKGDEVIAPSHTFTASVYPFIKKGANVVWADIDPETHVVTADTIYKCISRRTRVIIVVHLYGYCADMPSIMALAEEYGILIVEDAAQAIGTSVHGKMAGSFGDFGVFSFHSHKNITTLGEGGILTVKNKKAASIVPSIRHNGHCEFSYTRADYWIPAMGNVDLPELDGKTIWPGNYCIGEVECALGVKLLERVDRINTEKRRRALDFIDALNDFPELKFFKDDTERHSYHLLVARVKNGWRDVFIRKMAMEKSIQCVVQYFPLNRYDFYKKCGFGSANCPVADDFFDNMVSFPFHQGLSEEDLKTIVHAAREVLKEMKATM